MIAIITSLVRNTSQNASFNERKKIKKFKFLLKKKSLDFFKDPQISGTLGFVLAFGAPFFLSRIKNPTYFGKYSTTALIINFFYIITTIFLFFSFISQRKKPIQNTRLKE